MRDMIYRFLKKGAFILQYQYLANHKQSVMIRICPLKILT